MNHPSRPANEAGLTLTELTVALLVFGALAVATLPLVGTALGETQARGAGKQVLSEFRRARQQAIAAAAAYTVTVNPSTISIACINNTPAGNICPPNRAPDSVEPVLDGVTLSSSRATFTMGSTGGATPGTVAVTSPVATWQVAVNAAGGVRLCETTCP